MLECEKEDMHEETIFSGIHQCWLEAQHWLLEQASLSLLDHAFVLSLYHRHLIYQQLLFYNCKGLLLVKFKGKKMLQTENAQATSRVNQE